MALTRTPSPPHRGDVYLVALDPTRGHEIRKTRPCLIVSPDELNHHLGTAIIAPMTTSGRAYPFRIPCTFRRKKGFVVLDQLRTVDRERLRKRQGALAPSTLSAVLLALAELFEP
jgi:mRNA interferase MazF